MNILLVSTQKPDSTGSGVYITQLARSFVAAGHEVVLVAGVACDDVYEFPEGIRFVPVVYESDQLPFCVCGMSDIMPYSSTRYCDMTPQMVGRLKCAFDEALDDIVSGFEPDLCLSNHLYLLTAHIALRYPDLAVYAICHGTDLRQFEKTDLAREEIRAGLSRLAGAFALHDEQANHIRKLHGMAPDDVHVVGTGCDLDVFSAGEKARLEDRRKLLYAGKISRFKGVLSLLRALELLDVRVELDLAGGAGCSEDLERARALADASSCEVSFLGKLDPKELARAYSAANVFVLPSFFEGLPLVVIEALSCGCTVAMTDLPGLSSWFSRFAPDAPIVYIEPPRMEHVDVPIKEDLPAFEARLAAGIEQALFLEGNPSCVAGLSWESLAERILNTVRAGGDLFDDVFSLPDIAANSVDATELPDDATLYEEVLLGRFEERGLS